MGVLTLIRSRQFSRGKILLKTLPQKCLAAHLVLTVVVAAYPRGSRCACARASVLSMVRECRRAACTLQTLQFSPVSPSTIIEVSFRRNDHIIPNELSIVKSPCVRSTPAFCTLLSFDTSHYPLSEQPLTR